MSPSDVPSIYEKQNSQSFPLMRPFWLRLKASRTASVLDGLVQRPVVFGKVLTLGTANNRPHPAIAKLSSSVSKTTRLMSTHLLNGHLKDDKKTLMPYPLHFVSYTKKDRI